MSDFLLWVGVVFLVLGVADAADALHYRYGLSFSRWRSGVWRRFRSWRLDRHVNASIKRYGYKRAGSTPFGKLRFTRSRKEEFLKVKDVHPEGDSRASR